VALRTPEWKLVVRDGTEPPQLYDLLSDPREAQPLSGDAHAARLAEARARLSRFEAAEQQLAERLPASNVEIELPSELREALEQLGYGE
jgi:arylsulfatase A-like enzyme